MNLPLCAVALVIAALAVPSADSAEFSFDKRVAECAPCGYSVSKLSPPASELLVRLSAWATKLGRMPSVREYQDFLVDSPEKLTSDDAMHLTFLFGTMQRPSVERQDLVNILRAQRAALSSIRVKYRVATSGDDPKPSAGDRSLRCDFALEEPRLLYKCSVFQDETFVEESTEAYDGKVVRSVLEEPDTADNASLVVFDLRRRFIKDTNPLLCTRLLDYRTDLDEEGKSEDAAAFLEGGWVFETPIEVDGTSLLVFGNDTSQFYCSAPEGYAIARVVHGEVTFNKKLGRYQKTGNLSVSVNSERRQVLPSVWLPQRCEHSVTRGGAVKKGFVTTVENWTVNEKLPDSLFSDVIPKGAFVKDGIQNATYRWGDKPEPSRNTASSRPEPRRYTGWMIAANVLLIAVLCGLFLAKRLRQ